MAKYVNDGSLNVRWMIFYGLVEKELVNWSFDGIGDHDYRFRQS
jgi:hypothetical protein